MAGWVVMWTRDGAAPDATRWERTLHAARKLGASVDESSRGEVACAAWRRDKGEFPRSGTLAHPRLGTVVAWVGQVLADDGDATDRAILTLAAGSPSDETLAALNGPFAAAIVGPTTGDVTVVTDRFRHYPVYVHHAKWWSVASTDLSCVAPWLESRELDAESADLLLRTGELIDRATLIKGVELLPPATVLSSRGTGATSSERRYWRMTHTESSRDPLDVAAARVGELLKRSVRRIERASPRLAVTLSGGLDSRFIHGLCERRKDIPAFTWGLPGCRDIACAAAFAKRIGAPHEVRHWDVAAFPPLWARGASLTAGSFGIESMHMLPFTGLLSEHADVILNGLAGDVIAGGNFLKLAWLRSTDPAAIAADSWRWRVDPRYDASADTIIGGRVKRGSSRDRWISSIVSHSGSRPVARLNDWLYPNRIFRYTNSGTMLLRGAVESHAPFFDNDLVDYLVTVPLSYKLKHRLYLEALKRACRDAAATPWQRTGIAPARGFTANLASMGFQRYTKALLKRVGVDAYRSDMVADPPGWLRSGWRAPVEVILRSESLASRNIVDRIGIESVWARHLAGENLPRPIAAIVAMELFARVFIDGSEPAR